MAKPKRQQHQRNYRGAGDERGKGGGLPWKRLVFAAIVSALLAVYCELFRETIRSGGAGFDIPLLTGTVTLNSAGFTLVAFALSFAVIGHLVVRGKAIGRFCFKWRYAIALALLVVLVAIGVSGSSIAMWEAFLMGGDASNASGLAFGVPRGIRSDEWLVLTPMSFSQQFAGYSATSDLLRATATDVTMTYALPCWSLATLFRPFLWGYLVLGSARGLSFFWCARLIALFMVSFEFGRFITKDNRLASLAYAMLVAFAPAIQWWFAINGIAELFIFGQGLVLAFAAFLNARQLAPAIGFAALFAYLGDAFILIVYPAWQITVGYVVLALLVAVVASHARTMRSADEMTRISPAKRWVPFALFILAAFALLGVVLTSSADAIRATMSTAYPGARFEAGGGEAPLLFAYVTACFGSIVPDVFALNVCESCQTLFSLFPLGIILAVFALAKRRDPFLICLLCAEALLLVYACIGLPEWLARISLLSMSTPDRAILAISFSETLLLVRAITALSGNAAKSGAQRRDGRADARIWVDLALALAFALLATLAAALFSQQIAEAHALYALAFAFIALVAYAMLRAARSPKESWRLPVAACLVVLAGLCVNPVQIGAAPLEDNDYVRSVHEVAISDDSAQWLADSDFMAQACVAAGAPTVNSVATYPDLDRWHALDESGAYEDIYNRYAHISISPTSGETSFELLHADAFVVHVNPDDLEKLGVSYWVSATDLAAFDTASVHFEPVGAAGPDTIFRIEQK